MTAPELVFFIGAFVAGLAIGAAGMTWLLGPDPDLPTPSRVGEARSPGSLRRPCLTEGCRVDHERIQSNYRVW